MAERVPGHIRAREPSSNSVTAPSRPHRRTYRNGVVHGLQGPSNRKPGTPEHQRPHELATEQG